MMLPSTLLTTFSASMKSIGTACTMTAVGIYLHWMGIVGKEGKRTLALISQQVTVPLYLFTKILYCNQDWSNQRCPDITESLGDVWILLLWPIYVVGIGR
jgi:predicted permease